MTDKYKKIFLIFLVLLLSVFLVALNFFILSQKKYIAENVIGDFEKITEDHGDVVSLLLNKNNEATTTSAIATSSDIKLLFFGDLMLDRNVKTKIAKNGLDSLLSELKTDNFTSGYNIVACNLEGAVTDGGEHYNPINAYDFAFAPDLVNQLKDYNFNYFNLANNHLSDQGVLGIEQTYKNLSNSNFYYSGCLDATLSNSSSSALVNVKLGETMPTLTTDNCSDIILEIQGQKIAMVGVSAVYKEIDAKKLIERIKILKENSNWVIVNFHSGVEYKTKSNSNQQNLYHQIIDAGADVIIGHHPHVAQEYEVYNGKPIFYSLGNFIFDQYFSAETQAGLAVSLILKADNSIYFDVYNIKTGASKITEITKIEKPL